MIAFASKSPHEQQGGIEYVPLNLLILMNPSIGAFLCSIRKSIRVILNYIMLVLKTIITL